MTTTSPWKRLPSKLLSDFFKGADMENFLNFDINAMVKPKSRQDLIALAHEALAELAIINEVLDEVLSSTPEVASAD